MSKLYLVYACIGAYEDRRTVAVCAYRTKEQAEQHVRDHAIDPFVLGSLDADHYDYAIEEIELRDVVGAVQPADFVRLQ